MSDIEELAVKTVVDITAILSDTVQIIGSREDFCRALDSVQVLLQARSELARDAAQ